jgi:hypothetical protein
MSEKIKICKFFLKGECNHGENCKFVHDKEVCKNYFFDGKCKYENKCKFEHNITIAKKRHPKNTENFSPSHEPASMNVLVGLPNQNKFYKNIYDSNDVIIVPDFLKEDVANDLYNKLLHEINSSGIEHDKLWKLWHGDSHLIADDHLNWKEKVPTFQYIIETIEKYFTMEVKSTRFNYYKDSNDWKPYHHDAAAVKPHIAEKQNFTVGVSLGATRDISFEYAVGDSKKRAVVSIPLLNCTCYAFGSDVNINWKHGVPQVDPKKAFNEGRISIIAWGKVIEN